jgi:hypothetical protein
MIANEAVPAPWLREIFGVPNVRVDEAFQFDGLCLVRKVVRTANLRAD